MYSISHREVAVLFSLGLPVAMTIPAVTTASISDTWVLVLREKKVFLVVGEKEGKS